MPKPNCNWTRCKFLSLELKISDAGRILLLLRENIELIKIYSKYHHLCLGNTFKFISNRWPLFQLFKVFKAKFWKKCSTTWTTNNDQSTFKVDFKVFELDSNHKIDYFSRLFYKRHNNHGLSILLYEFVTKYKII